jgi:hypothetical protein
VLVHIKVVVELQEVQNHLVQVQAQVHQAAEEVVVAVAEVVKSYSPPSAPPSILNPPTTSTPVSTYDEAGIDLGGVDAEDEYLAPDPDHYKATQKAIGKTNQELRELGLDKSDWSDWTKEEQDTYQAEMNKIK